MEIQASVCIFVWPKRSLDSLFGGPTGPVVDDICFERGLVVWSSNEREVRLEVISPWVGTFVSCALEMAAVDAVDYHENDLREDLVITLRRLCGNGP